MSKKLDLRPYLQVARHQRGGGLPEACARKIADNAIQVRVIEDIEELEAQLQLEALRKRKVLHERCIPLDQTRTSEPVPLFVPFGPELRNSKRRRRKQAVQEGLAVRRLRIPGGGDIRPIVVVPVAVIDIGR